MFCLVTQYVMLHCVVLLIWLLETRFLVTLLESVWICFFFYRGEVFEKITSCFIWSRNRLNMSLEEDSVKCVNHDDGIELMCDENLSGKKFNF